MDFNNPEIGDQLNRFLKGKNKSMENRRRVLRLIENMVMGRNAVVCFKFVVYGYSLNNNNTIKGYLTESMHGAGSPQAQRVVIAKMMDLQDKIKLAKNLAGIVE